MALRLALGAPLLAVLVAFALSNAQPVRLGLWPADGTLEMPLSIAVLSGAGAAFLAGGLIVWAAGFGPRRRLRAAERALRLMEEELRAARAQAARPPAAPPAIAAGPGGAP